MEISHESSRMKNYAINRISDYLNWLREERGEAAKNPSFRLVKQLYAMQAWIVEDEANGIVCLQSFDRIVSAVPDGTLSITRLGARDIYASRQQLMFERLYKKEMQSALASSTSSV